MCVLDIAFLPGQAERPVWTGQPVLKEKSSWDTQLFWFSPLMKMIFCCGIYWYAFYRLVVFVHICDLEFRTVLVRIIKSISELIRYHLTTNFPQSIRIEKSDPSSQIWRVTCCQKYWSFKSLKYAYGIIIFMSTNLIKCLRNQGPCIEAKCISECKS